MDRNVVNPASASRRYRIADVQADQADQQVMLESATVSESWAQRHRTLSYVLAGVASVALYQGTTSVLHHNFSNETSAVTCTDLEKVGNNTTFVEFADKQLDALHSTADRTDAAYAMGNEYQRLTGKTVGELDPATEIQTCIQIGNPAIASFVIKPA